MAASKQTAFDYIDEKSGVITDVSDKIWDYAELSLREYKSGELYAKVLKEEGFTVEHPFDNIETAFRASYGSGKPVIGILAEYDALTGLSQIAGSETRKELVTDGNGHGCGHNLLGAGSMAAAFAIKKYLEEKGEGSGKVILYGCPGEEGAATKAFMARDGVFAECDAALTWHPGNVNQVTSGTCNTCIQTEYKFTGVASHAAGAPDKGRSALDAVELMNIGVQFLREHMPDSARIHYSITDAGGDSPNVVQPKAQVLYMVRSIWVKDALELQERVDRIALAASMMTDTKMEKKFIDGCSNTRFFFMFVIPLSKAIIAVISLYIAVAHWNNYYNALVYTTDASLQPLNLYLRHLLLMTTGTESIMESDANAEVLRLVQTVRYAVIVLSALPIMCLYPFLQKYFVQGVMIGSIKG